MKKLYRYHKTTHHFLGVAYPDGNRKQDRMISLAFAPEHSCPKDAPCRRENGGTCYYQAEGLYMPSVAQSARNNWRIFCEDPERFWRSFEKACQYAQKEGIGLRPFEGGDMPSYEFFERLMTYAIRYPGLMHGMTKRYAFVNRYIKEHGGDKSCILDYYHLRLSEWANYPCPNEYGMPTFTLTYEEKETTCLEQRMKMLGKEWSCQDCHDRHLGCYDRGHRSIKCIDHATEAKIVRKRGFFAKKATI